MSPELRAAVDGYLAAAAGGGRSAAAALSQHYRAQRRSDHSVDPAAYLTVRLPATSAAVARVLAEVRRRRPDFAPQSLLDAGAGPGTASWAALDCWPAIAAVRMLDRHAPFRQVAARLAAASPSAALAGAAIEAGDLCRLGPADAASLVIASYALAEVAAGELRRAADALWQATADVLVLVEPGTPAGFERLRQVRTQLLGEGAVVVAPCPAAGTCPMAAPDWCHFAVRLPRRRAHMHAKAASLPFEDEKFAYLALGRRGSAPGGARILAPPVDRKPGLSFRLCTGTAVVPGHIARRDRDAYKAAKHRVWGDLLPDADEMGEARAGDRSG